MGFSPAEFLAAISCGAVMMGANTYIGNAPNLTVKAIAEHSGLQDALVLRLHGLFHGHPHPHLR